MVNKTVLDEVVTGRVEPHIYAFTTNTVPNYLKVGDTYRPIAVRLKEWEEHYPKLEKQFEGTAKIDDVYFRDYSVHQFLETEKQKARLQQDILPSNVYYSKEFFKEATADDVSEAIMDIQNDYRNKTQKYQFYSVDTLRPEETVFPRTENYPMRPNQEKTVNAFKTAIANGRKNLLMYAVIRFGKSFTSMCCAAEMGARLVVVVSAKADVMFEWKKTVESHVKFDGYDFITSRTLSNNEHTVTEKLNSGKGVVVFLTLQDLQGDTVKNKHKEIFGEKIDLLLVDETHFGARAEKFGKVIKNAKNYESDVVNKNDNDDFVDINEADKAIKTLNVDITVHLSGTPYRILMGSEFKKEDIIAFYQFTDIADDQKAWDKAHVLDDNYKEWDNPYYGFPQMLRFAFRPNASSRRRLEELKKNGTTYAFSTFFKPYSLKKTDDGAHKKFVYEKEILDLLEVIDGSEDDDEFLSFLDYDKFKEGKMCRHIVIVLPYCASCDALEELIKTNKDKFRNLNGYEIINISGIDQPNAYKSPKEIKTTISRHEANDKKTITLTVNRMLTGSTVPEWDTMLHFKDTASPQEYDQAVFRLQNQYIKTYTDKKTGNTIKFNMKPQTLLVDFDPNRMFIMQEKKSKIYNANVDTGGNTELEKRIKKELEISPIIAVNKDKLVRVEAFDILKAVNSYKKDKGIKDEALEIPVDLSILDDEAIRSVIELENEIGSKSGLSVPAHGGNDGNDEEGDELNIPETATTQEETEQTNTRPYLSSDDKHKAEISLTKKIQSYYTRILLFAFITNAEVISLSDIIESMKTDENGKIAKNLGLKQEVLKHLNQKTNKFTLSDMDYSIQYLNALSRNETLSPNEKANIAINKFGKLGEAVVVTPSKICDDMVNLLPEEFIKSLPSSNGKILDIAGTSGEFAVALYKKMTKFGLDKSFIANAIYTIPKSSVCYELTKKLYEMLGLNSENIAQGFTANDILNVKNGKNIDYEKLCEILRQQKQFNTIKLTDNVIKGEVQVNFEAVVGNPPYQENISKSENNEALGKQLFPSFVQLSIKLTQNYCSLLTPSRWFTGDAQDKSFIKLRKFVKNNNCIKSVYNFYSSNDIFNDVVVKGGINYFLYQKDYNGLVDFFNHKNGGYTLQTRALFEKGLDIILSSSEDFNLIQKVQDNNFVSFTSITNGRNAFGIIGKESSLKNITQNAPFDNSVRLQCKAETVLWTSKCNITKNEILVDKYKVFISKSAGDPSKDLKIIGKPYIGEPNSACTDSLIPVGCFDTLIEAENLSRYMKTKFLRYLVRILKTSQNVTQIVYKFVPLQDFTENSDIDWSKSIHEIDQQLYKKYNLTEEEISFIEKTIKPME